ncbi:MAG: hypothetical protein K2I90_02775 [Odoribacter sp.]|nr:hypothetical protein [Odoribacter sp.]
MKKIWLMLLVICSVCAFSACSDDDDEKKDGGIDEECPVTDVVVPSPVAAGDEVTITGKGFAETALLVLGNIEIVATFTETEANFMLPYNFEPGDYKVILKQNGKEWELSPNMKVTAPTRALRVKEIVADFKTYTFTYNQKNQISSIGLYSTEAPDELQTYNIEYTSDELINITGDATFNLSLQNGKVVYSNNVLGDDYEWSYDEDDEYLTYGGYYEIPYEYENKNLIKLGDAYNSMPFEYNKPELKNNLYLVDIIFISKYMILGDELFEGWDYHFDMIPHMLNICGNRSENLPSHITDGENAKHEVDYVYSDIYKDYVSEITYEYYLEEDYLVSKTIKIIYE